MRLFSFIRLSVWSHEENLLLPQAVSSALPISAGFPNELKEKTLSSFVVRKKGVLNLLLQLPDSVSG